MKNISIRITLLMLALATTVNLPAQSPTDVVVSHSKKNDFRSALKPVPQTAIFKMEGYNLWDPSVIKVGDTYHLFASRWSFNKGWDAWRESEVIRAVSKSLYGPYTFVEVVLSPSTHPWATQGVHNPKITKVGDKYLLYHLGIPRWQTGFAFADNIEGPCRVVDKPVVPTSNPSIMVKPDGKVYAVGKFKPAKTLDGRWDAYMNAFEADDIMGPYNLVGGETNRLPYNFELEDPTIWWANNQYNVICTDWEAKVTGSEKAVLMYTSKNGVDYTLYSKIPIWTREEGIPIENGEVLKSSMIERPDVYLDKKGRVEALVVSVQPSYEECSYIVIRPVNKFTPTNK